MEGYCNAPIIVETTGFAQRTGAYFPCMVLKIGALPFTAECGSGKKIRFDLSKYAQGLLYNKSISPTNSVPTSKIDYTIWERQFLGGTAEDTKRASEGGSIDVYLGRGYRFKSDNLTESGKSVKPTDIEVVNTGDYLVARGQTTDVTANKVSESTTGVYIEDNTLRHQLIFLNSFGRWESASALTRENKQYKYSSTTVNVDTTFPDNTDRPDKIINKQLDEVIWNMSSGYVTRQWAHWWAEEVLASEYVWMRDGTRLIPVVLVPNDNTTIYNKGKGNLVSIGFKVKFV